MTDVTRAPEVIKAAADELGLPAFAELANVPYTTVLHWKQKGWQRPRALDTYDRLIAAAEAHAASRSESRE